MPKPKRRRRRKILVALALLVVSGGGFAFYQSRKPDDVIAVTIDKVARRDLTEIVIANGRLQPATQVIISPEVAGEIVELPVVEGQAVKKGDLLVQIKPDNYQASRNSAEASYKVSLGTVSQAEAELAKAEADFHRTNELSKSQLITGKEMQDMKTTLDIARLRLTNAKHQVDQARFTRDRTDDDLSKTKITAPIDGTIVRLRSQLGERVLGTSFNMGTEIMTIADLDAMEARVDVSEIDVVLIQTGQNVRMDVDAFKDRKFNGTVTAIANASRGSGSGSSSSGGGGSMMGSSSSQEAPKFDVRIRIQDKEAFRPGMSVTAEIETRSRKNALSVPIQAVTTRLPAGATKPTEVVFLHEGDHAKQVQVKSGISNNDHFEIIEGLSEGQSIISGGYKAVAKDLEDGKKVKLGDAKKDPK
jgi:HlyD family secretion protein